MAHSVPKRTRINIKPENRIAFKICNFGGGNGERPFSPDPERQGLTCGIHYSFVVFVLRPGPLLDFIMFVLSVLLSYLPLASIKLCP